MTTEESLGKFERELTMGREMSRWKVGSLLSIVLLFIIALTAVGQEKKAQKHYGLDDFPTAEDATGARFFAAMRVRQDGLQPNKDKAGEIIVRLSQEYGAYHKKDGTYVFVGCWASVPEDQALSLTKGGKYNVAGDIVSVKITFSDASGHTVPAKDKNGTIYVEIELTNVKIR